MTDSRPEESNAEPATEDTKQKGLSKEAWAAISAIAVALIGGAVAIATALIPKLQISQPSSPPSESISPSVGTVDATNTADAITADAITADAITADAITADAITADAIAGKWSGEAKTTSGEFYTINVEIHQSCNLNEKCGTISVIQVPCYGEISLVAFQNEDYEFDVSNFDERSSSTCTPGAGEHFIPLPGERLSYRADWGVQGILDKVQ